MDFTPYITAAIMLLGILVGTLISPKIQHRVGREYGKKDLLFKKKLEYFEKIIETIEKNKRMYHQTICRIEEAKNKKEMEKIIEESKKNRKNFLIMASPLYFDTRKFSEKIINFVRIEKNIFNQMDKLKTKNKTEQEKGIERLEEGLRLLNNKGKDILIEMRKELSK